jgi:hypothetical protein
MDLKVRNDSSIVIFEKGEFDSFRNNVRFIFGIYKVIYILIYFDNCSLEIEFENEKLFEFELIS